MQTKNQGVITVKGRNVQLAVRSHLLKDWVDKLDITNLKLKSIEVQSMTVIQRKGTDHVLFMLIKADIFDSKGRRLPGTFFLRGAAAGMLIVLEQADNKDEWVVLIESAMPSIGQMYYPQLPAGMMDGETDGVAVAVREIAEETHFCAKPADVIDLTAAFYGGTWPGIYPSPGACDEYIRLFLYRKTMTDRQIRAISGRQTGLAAEHEHLKLRVVRLSDLCRITPDVKAHSAFLMFELLRRNKLKREL